LHLADIELQLGAELLGVRAVGHERGEVPGVGLGRVSCAVVGLWSAMSS
jgi:hypothetical protein